MKKKFLYLTALLLLGTISVRENSFGAEQHPITLELEGGPIVVSTRFDVEKIQTLLKSWDEQSKNGTETSVLSEEIIGSGALDLFRLFGMCLQYSATKIGLESESRCELLSNLAQNIANCWKAENAIESIGTALHKLVYRYSTPEESKEIDAFLREKNINFYPDLLTIYGQICGDKKFADLEQKYEDVIQTVVGSMKRVLGDISNSIEADEKAEYINQEKLKFKKILDAVFTESLKSCWRDLKDEFEDKEVTLFGVSNLSPALTELLNFMVIFTNPIYSSDLIKIRKFSEKIIDNIDWAYNSQRRGDKNIYDSVCPLFTYSDSMEYSNGLGSAAVISFEGMPEELTGKLVMTCGHCYCTLTRRTKYTDDPYPPIDLSHFFTEKILDDESVIAYVDKPKLRSKGDFPALSQELQYNYVTYAEYRLDQYKVNMAFLHPSLDIAILLLDKNAGKEGVYLSAKNFSDEFGVQNPYFYILGFGSEVDGLGWYCKKAKLMSEMFIQNSSTHHYLRFLNNYVSGGDSGGPILFRDPKNPHDIQCVGVAACNGPNPYMNQELFDWIKFVSTKAAEILENPDASQAPESQSIPQKIAEKSQD